MGKFKSRISGRRAEKAAGGKRKAQKFKLDDLPGGTTGHSGRSQEIEKYLKVKEQLRKNKH